MDNKIKTSLVAAAVSAVLSSTAIAAPQSTKQLPNFDFNASVVKAKQQAKARSAQLVGGKQQVAGKQFNAKGFTAISQSIDATTLRDHFDKNLGVNTFSWAKPSQKFSSVPHSVMGKTQAASRASMEFLEKVGAQHGVSKTAMQEAELKGIHNVGRGAVIARYQQKVNGIEVLNRQLNVVMNQRMELVATTGYFLNNSGPRGAVTQQFKLSAGDALKNALTNMGAKTTQFKAVGQKGGFDIFEADSDKFRLLHTPRVKQVYYPGLKNLMPAYLIEVIAAEKGDREHLGYQYVVSATDGKVLQRTNLVANEAFSYRVLADATAPYTPYDSPMGNGLSPHPSGVYNEVFTETQASMNLNTFENSGISTNDPWLPADATVTYGNNVDAYADLVPGDYFFTEGGDIRADVTSERTFDYQYDVNADTNTESNIKAAVVNLFYTINQLHDTYYDHGFNEQWGTAQLNNYGRGGQELDPMQAQGLDGEGFDNANMLTPLDGTPPRMQMYLWVADGGSSVSVGDLKGLNSRVASGWGARDYNLDGTIVRYQDANGTTACIEASNASELAGKIAIIDRGGCSFTQKALNAQAAGAVGVIVANSDVANPDAVIGMAPSDGFLSVTIPVLMVSYNNGQAIYSELKEGRDTANMTGKIKLRDGTVDNGIVAHEWGHYISSRLTERGMYTNSQGRSMGEGWGDFFALMMMVREEDRNAFNNANWGGIYNAGGFAVSHGNTPNGYYFGIRRVPYSTDMNYNALTFKHIQDFVPLPDNHPVQYGQAGEYNAEVHAAGEVWANALWEGYAAMLNRTDISFSEAQSKMRDYMVAGMKITPATPTFTEARDAMLAVAIADDLENYNLMRAGFTKRGMGPAAVSPDRNDSGWDGDGHAGIVEDFDQNLAATQLLNAELDTAYMGANGGYCDNDDVLDVRETAAIKLTVRNVGVVSANSLKAKVTTDSEVDIEFGNDGMVEFTGLENWNDVVTGIIEVKLNGATTNQEVNLHIEFMSDDENLSIPHEINATINVHRDLVKSDTRINDDFEMAFLSEQDWSQYKTGDGAGGHFLEDWTVVPEEYMGEGATSTMMGPDRGVEGDLALMTPKVTVGDSGDFMLSFDHFYWMEASEYLGSNVMWDGGVMEVSIDGGEWVDVVDAGGVFATGYNGIINPGDGVNYGPNPSLGGRAGFVNVISSFWLEPESLTYAEGTLNGHEVQFRFRIGTDSNTPEWGWNIDNVQFTNATPAWSIVAEDADMCNPPPVVTANQSSVSVKEREDVTLSVTGSDVDDEALTYTWLVDGVDVGNNSSTYHYTAPRVTEDTTVHVQVIAHDGRNPSEPATITVNIDNASSGGGLGLVSLLLAPLAFIRRRKIK